MSTPVMAVPAARPDNIGMEQKPFIAVQAAAAMAARVA